MLLNVIIITILLLPSKASFARYDQMDIYDHFILKQLNEIIDITEDINEILHDFYMKDLTIISIFERIDIHGQLIMDLVEYATHNVYFDYYEDQFFDHETWNKTREKILVSKILKLGSLIDAIEMVILTECKDPNVFEGVLRLINQQKSHIRQMKVALDDPIFIFNKCLVPEKQFYMNGCHNPKNQTAEEFKYLTSKLVNNSNNEENEILLKIIELINQGKRSSLHQAYELIPLLKKNLRIENDDNTIDISLQLLYHYTKRRWWLYSVLKDKSDIIVKSLVPLLQRSNKSIVEKVVKIFHSIATYDDETWVRGRRVKDYSGIKAIIKSGVLREFKNVLTQFHDDDEIHFNANLMLLRIVLIGKDGFEAILFQDKELFNNLHNFIPEYYNSISKLPTFNKHVVPETSYMHQWSVCKLCEFLFDYSNKQQGNVDADVLSTFTHIFEFYGKDISDSMMENIHTQKIIYTYPDSDPCLKCYNFTLLFKNSTCPRLNQTSNYIIDKYFYELSISDRNYFEQFCFFFKRFFKNVFFEVVRCWHEFDFNVLRYENYSYFSYYPKTLFDMFMQLYVSIVYQ